MESMRTLIDRLVKDGVREALAELMADEAAPAQPKPQPMTGARFANRPAQPRNGGAMPSHPINRGPRTGYVAATGKGLARIIDTLPQGGNDEKVYSVINRSRKPLTASTIESLTGLKGKAVESSLYRLATSLQIVDRVDLRAQEEAPARHRRVTPAPARKRARR